MLTVCRLQQKSSILTKTCQPMPIDPTANLPIHLLERTRIYQQGENVAGQFVLYWMRTAVRADENPALETALALAARRSLPVLVYHAISQHYEYASDRHHTFMLEGARDVQKQLRERGISYAFHLATRDDRKMHLVTLAAFWRASGISPHKPSQLQAHRWKFAIPVDPPVERCYFDKEFGIAACGDWASGTRVEGAFLSGMAAAGRILGTLSVRRHATQTQLALF